MVLAKPSFVKAGDVGRYQLVAQEDLILVLDEGRLVETGTHAELLRAGGTYARLLERQLLAEAIEAE